MHAVRRVVVWIFAAACFAGAMPHAPALGWVTIAVLAKTPCPESTCTVPGAHARRERM